MDIFEGRYFEKLRETRFISGETEILLEPELLKEIWIENRIQVLINRWALRHDALLRLIGEGLTDFESISDEDEVQIVLIINR